MMARALLFIIALSVSAPSAAQTLVVNLKGAADIGDTIFSPRGDRIAAIVGRDRVGVWSLPDGRLMQSIEFAQQPAAILFASHADELIVALADGAIDVRAIATGASVRRVTADGRQTVLAASTDGRLLASSGAGRITLWDGNGKQLRTFGHAFGGVAALAFSADGALLASAGADANVHLWDVSSGALKASLRDPLLVTFGVAFTADSKSLVIGGVNGTIEIADVATGSITRRLPAQKHAVGTLSLSPDGRSVGAAYFDTDGMTRQTFVALWQLASGRIVQRVTPPGGPASAVGFGSDGRLFYATVKGSELSVWTVAQSRTKQTSQ
jgi:WD40 repeat protein